MRGKEILFSVFLFLFSMLFSLMDEMNNFYIHGMAKLAEISTLFLFCAYTVT